MESQELHIEKYIMTGYIANIENLIQQYRNVIEQSGSFETLDMGEVLLPQIQENLNMLKDRHTKRVESSSKGQK